MSMMRNQPTSGGGKYASVFVPGGVYLGTATEVREFDDDGVRYQKIYVDRATGLQGDPKDAVVLMFNLDQVMDGPEECDDVVGQTAAKKVTDSLHEKATLYKIVKALTGEAPQFPFDLASLVGTQGVLTVENGTRKGSDGKDYPTSYIAEIARYIKPRAARVGGVPSINEQVAQMAATAGGTDLPF